MADRYILLPPRGVRGKVPVPSVSEVRFTPRPKERRLFTWTLGERGEEAQEKLDVVRTPVTVVDGVAEDGPKLLDLSEHSIEEVRDSSEGRLVPERHYRPAAIGELPISPPPGAVPGEEIEFEVRCRQTAAPLEGARLTALVDVQNRLGGAGVSDPRGEVRLALGPPPVEIEALTVAPPRRGWWGGSAKDLSVHQSHVVELEPLDLNLQPPDVLRHFYGSNPPGKNGKGVRVGVIDSGIADHPDLTVSGGVNAVPGENAADYGDNGLGHGTHVAGIVAAHGSAPGGIRGLAPEVELWSFRVYGAGRDTASSYSIMKALWEAAAAGCDLVNLSMEAPDPDTGLDEAIADARSKGMVVVGAAGNGGRGPVASPARYAFAASALGRAHTFPAGSFEESQVAAPAGSDPDDFLAGFSNVGTEVSFVAPGLGVVSTVPGGHAPEAGTSMAAAAVTGIGARLLSDAPAVMGMARDAGRSKAISTLLAKSAKAMGLGPACEGFGML